MGRINIDMNRRNFLQIGGLGAFGVNLFDTLQAQGSQGKAAVEGKAKSVIHIYLPGGSAHQETWDPKYLSPAEYRGPLGTVDTSIIGHKFSENLRQTAKIADKITVIRSMTHGEAAHERGTHSMITGYKPSPALEYPSMGSVTSHEFGGRNNLPAYIAIPKAVQKGGPGYLSNAYSPFSIGANPESANFKVRDLALPTDIDVERFGQRQKMRTIVDTHFNAHSKISDQMRAMNTFYDKAYSLISSDGARAAFDLNKETKKTKEAYGLNSAGQRFLLARRLVEAGTRFVTVTYGGWDHHNNIKDNITRQLQPFDQAYAQLITDLDQRGLLDSTLVIVSSEFGRTPKINATAGRDHWPKVFSIAMAGGGIKRGYVHGMSDPTGSEPEEDPFTNDTMAATVFHLLGIDPDKDLMASGNRPIKIAYNSKPEELILA